MKHFCKKKKKKKKKKKDLIKKNASTGKLWARHLHIDNAHIPVGGIKAKKTFQNSVRKCIT